MSSSMICMSHSPLMLVKELRPRERDAEKRFYDTLRDYKARLAARPMDVVVVFSPDHFNGFFYDAMPSFCIGTEARTTQDWALPGAELKVDAALAESLIRHLHGKNFDVAISRRMQVDHGVSIPLLKLFGSLRRPLVIPVFVNCAADPRPSFKRVRQFGEAVGKFFSQQNRSVLFIGSGGLSHDPPTPRPGAPKEALQRLIDRHTPDEAEYRRRESRVIENALQLAAGTGPLQAPDRQWDKTFIDRLLAGQLRACDRYTDAAVDRDAGFGGHEARVWLAAFAAMHATQAFQATLDFYRVIPEWITGMAAAHACLPARST
ncbi:MAG: 3-carboxyethylcatechol 2,3-dioxygenase [Rhodoferax sp.]|jgi:2,3-dihydroxyphenylpropionate 1,2-dioxygenase|nr:3-carboxyethylcatechol 2,3-dioxygenase [Rhodoferax sp.]